MPIGRVPNVVGRIAVTWALLVVMTACSSPAASEGRIPEAAPGGTSGSSAAEQGAPPATARGAAAVTPRAASSTQRGFPYAEPQAEWIAATPWNYDRGRFGNVVELIVIHYTAIDYTRTLRAFTTPASGVSAHYVVRQDGHVTQMVSEDDTAWQAGNYWYNLRSVGIELELDLDRGTSTSFSDSQYYSTAALVCGIAQRHGILVDRAHVIGHSEVPGPGKIDPGPTWNWPHFMYLASLCAPPVPAGMRATFVAQSPWPQLEVGQDATFTVKLRNEGRVAWRRGGTSEVRLGLVQASRDQALVGNGWPLGDRPAVQQEEIVPPGKEATFTIPFRGAVAGQWYFHLRPVVDGVAWLPELGLYTIVTVKPEKPAKRARPTRVED